MLKIIKCTKYIYIYGILYATLYFLSLRIFDAYPIIAMTSDK